MVWNFSVRAMLVSNMSERQRLLALLEVYDEAIQELYVLGGPYVELILRLERRHQDAAARLAELDRPLVTSAG
jgi:hypothetical protein